MRNSMLMIVLVLVIATASSFAADEKQRPGKPPASTTENPQISEERAIRATGEAFTSAFNKGDAKRIAGLWTSDCEYVDETGRIIQGREAIEKEYAALFAAHPGVQIETSVSSVKMFGDKAATEDGTSIVKNSDGAPLSKGHYTAVLLKEGDKWLMASVREQASSSLSKRPDFGDLEWLIGDWTAAKDSKTVDFTFKWVADKKFIELSYGGGNKGATARSGIQIIGRDPLSGDVISWSFDSTGGNGQGHWRLLKKGLIIESRGMLPDGTPTASTDIVSRIDGDSFSWQSVNRSVAGQSLNDLEPVVLKRKSR
ncbi:MAG: YybH family protein [Desulfomonilaceae bacterium]